MRGRGFVAFVSVTLSIICLYYLSFTYYVYKVEWDAAVYAQGDFQKEQQYLDSVSKDTTQFLFLNYNYLDAKDRALSLGLDLKGGINVILQVSERDLLSNLADGSRDLVFLAALASADQKQQATGTADYLSLFFQAFQEQKQVYKSNVQLTSPDIFGGKFLIDQISYNSSDQEVEKVIRQKVETFISTAYDVIRSRIDRFGVSQPNIQRIERSGRILVELPGVKNVERVKKLLQSTAQLQFWEVYDPKVVLLYFQTLDKLSVGVSAQGNKTSGKADATETEGAIEKSGVEALLEKKKISKKNSAEVSATSPRSLLALLHLSNRRHENTVGWVDVRDTARVDRILNDPRAQELLPSHLRTIKFLWAIKPYESKNNFLELYAIRTDPEGKPALSGDVIISAHKSFGQFNQVVVNMQMNVEGSRIWKRVTEKNIGKSIAVVLDDLVCTAPSVNTVIPNGRSEISGNFTVQEADDLVNILNAGKLPTSARIIQAEIVGPSLGQEAIRSGLISSLIALGFVFVWMIFYYMMAGVYANFALVFNLLFIFGILISFGAVLTLPGIAGIVLTLAMAVDANILLYERVKEELYKGKVLRRAIDESYSFKGALPSIVDGQLTTFLTGIILFIFGKGPIQGFATTLIIGIFTSIFSAIWLARWFIEWHFEQCKGLSFFSRITEYFLKNFRWNFLSRRKYAYIFSLILMVVSLISLFTRGLNLGVDFVGGRTYVVHFDRSVTPEKIATDLAPIFIENGVSSPPEVKTFGGVDQVKITTKYKVDQDGSQVDEEVVKKLYMGLKLYLPAGVSLEQFKNVQDGRTVGVLSSVKVGPTVAKDITKGAFWAILFSLLGIFIYILIRFRRWQFSLGAVISLLHDSIVVLGVFSLCYGLLPFSLEIDQAFIAAILTVIGYSINDTVIVYDRIREYVYENPQRPFRQVVNQAISSTLSRTVNTSLITIFVVFVIFLFGGETIRGFMFALLVGIGFGIYSSVFVATALMYDFVKKILKKTGKDHLEKY
ncbi:MAG: protein translocase subunit SecDF [Flavobacteriales bacterium]